MVAAIGGVAARAGAGGGFAGRSRRRAHAAATDARTRTGGGARHAPGGGAAGSVAAGGAAPRDPRRARRRASTTLPPPRPPPLPRRWRVCSISCAPRPPPPPHCAPSTRARSWRRRKSRLCSPPSPSTCRVRAGVVCLPRGRRLRLRLGVDPHAFYILLHVARWPSGSTCFVFRRAIQGPSSHQEREFRL
uniref:Uncharacterized protein n=1 Tax=Emiliania huxleyi (strain CCMP1516) TaxID=280463 RepID=A0A0D3IY50_EMIH1